MTCRGCGVQWRHGTSHEPTPGCDKCAQRSYQRTFRMRRANKWLDFEPNRLDVGRYRRALTLDPCSYCGGLAGTLDHIDPRCNSADDSYENLTAACTSCNSSKQDRSLLVGLLWMSYASEREQLSRLGGLRA